MAIPVTREQVLGFRVRAQQLDRDTGSPADTAVLGIGVQDSGPDGALWALANRGVAVAAPPQDLAAAWTVRGSPHLYRRSELSEVAAATAPWSEADAAKRIYDAAKPLRAAGIPVLQALDTVAATMRAVVDQPRVKGVVSSRVAALVDEPYLRFCRPCDSIHLYEMPFRLAALRGGLELQIGTSPPVLQRIPGFAAPDVVSPAFDLVRSYLRLLGPATPADVAGYLDAPVREVKAHWPEDVVAVDVAGLTAWLLADDELPADPPVGTRLLGPFDLFLQARDRAVLVPDTAVAKTVWPVLGRPGVVLLDGDLVAKWRPRASGGRLTVRVQPWATLSTRGRRQVEDQAERLAAHRGVALAAVTFDD